LLQLKIPHRAHELLRRELSVLFVRTPPPWRPWFLHDGSGGSLGQTAATQPSTTDRNSRRQRPASRSTVRLLPRAVARLQANQTRHSSEVFYGGRDCLLRRSLRDD